MSSTKMRIEIEKKISRCAVRCILASDFAISVEDGDVTTLHHSTNAAEIVKAMFDLDDCTLIVINPKTAHPHGWVKFVFGNDGHDCISDYTVNMEKYLKTALLMAEKYA